MDETNRNQTIWRANCIKVIAELFSELQMETISKASRKSHRKLILNESR